MSFLKINDPLKRDAIVKEYLDLKNRIRSNLLSERIGESQLQTDLSKFYKPITETQKATTREITEGLKPIIETQKATTREITEGLKPIREGIEKLPEAIQPLRKATEEEEKKEEKSSGTLGETAYNYIHGKELYNRDKTFGIHFGQDGNYHMGAQQGKDGVYRGNHKMITIAYNNIYVDGKKFTGTPGLWELIMKNEPKKYTQGDLKLYGDLLFQTNAINQDFNRNNPYPRASKSHKWNEIIKPIWVEKTAGKGVEKTDGKGVVVIPSDPNALLERLDLLLASQEAGHTGVRNELVSICDELKRQGVLDIKAYKKLNHLIKK